jgi:transposase InsO family protein
MTSELIETALKRAIWSRKPPKGLIVHSDQGSQYVSNSYRKLLKAWGLKASMSRRGNCWDNAVAESFFKTLKVEKIYRQLKLVNAVEMRLLVSEYVGHYNHIRPHSKNSGMSPVRYEQHKMEQAKALGKNQAPCTKKG